MATISEEEENYVRMSFLLSGISTRAVRALFDGEFDSSSLNAIFKTEINTLTTLKERKIINLAEWTLLFPHNGIPDSNMFDIALMITLLTNLSGLIRCTTFSLETDTPPLADLETIKDYRNQLLHTKDGKIDNIFFNTAWSNIIQAVGRLGGKHLLNECKELREKTLEQSLVPWNIKVQYNQIIESWKTHSTIFVGTRAAEHVLECIQEHSCVTITAGSGVGKTAILQHVVLKMVDEGYDVLLVTNAHDIVKYYNPNQKTLFAIDDFCGTCSINQYKLKSLESNMDHLKELMNNKLTKIIVTCRLQLYQDDKFKSLSVFKTCVCNLHSEDLCLSEKEKQSIAEFYLESKSSEIIQYYDLYECFPLLCNLYIKNPEFKITDVVKHPFLVYEAEIDKLRKKKINRKYCALALCVMFNNRLSEELLTDKLNTEIIRMIENTCEACKLDRSTSRLVLLDELKTLEHTFIKKEQGVYQTIHDKMFDFLSFYLGKNMIQCVINNADRNVINQRFLLESEDGMNQFITIVPPKYHQMFLQRIIDDWYNGRILDVFKGRNMKNLKFRERFLCYLKTFNTSFQRKLAQICDVDKKDTVLLQCCQYDNIPLLEWCIDHGGDVNQCNSNELSPLGSNVDINKSSENGKSPLYVACCNNHKETVVVLLDNKADINKCTHNGVSPLSIACYYNHIEIVKVLLENKADINKCANNGESPLFIACRENHKEIVKNLLVNSAFINHCTHFKSSPLFVAFMRNHFEIVKMLEEKGADCNTDISLCRILSRTIHTTNE